MKQIKNRQRKNRRIKYNEKAYIENNYIVDGKAVIPVTIEKTDDLFMKHDFKKLELADDVCDYIEEIAYMIPMDTDIVIELHCPEVDDEMQIKMIKAIKTNYGMDIDDIDYDINKINTKSLWYGLIGIIILVINLITEPLLGEVFSNFICVVWWVAIWEMVELQTIEKSDAKWKRLNYQQLYDAEVTFVFNNK